MKLLGYIRVSTDAQADNSSLEEQEKRIRAYCDAYGHKLVKIFTEVASGKDTKNRPIFQQALEALHGADGIIAVKLDRITRNTKDVLTLVDDILQPEDKALVLLDLNVDTSTPTGKLILTVMAAVATLERDVIRERTQSGRRAKAEKGEFVYGSPHFGYVSVNGVLVPEEEEQKIIQLIRKHKRSGKSLNQIANFLNQHGYTTKRKKVWKSEQVRQVLRHIKEDSSKTA